MLMKVINLDGYHQGWPGRGVRFRGCQTLARLWIDVAWRNCQCCWKTGHSGLSTRCSSQLQRVRSSFFFKREELLRTVCEKIWNMKSEEMIKVGGPRVMSLFEVRLLSSSLRSYFRTTYELSLFIPRKWVISRKPSLELSLQLSSRYITE